MADDRAPKFTISSGLFEGKHREKMGGAIWVYGVLLDWQTDKDGTVMRGEPIQASIVATRLGSHERTVRREFERLESEGYIRRNRSGDGWQMWIINPKKNFREPDRIVRSARTDLSKPVKMIPVSGQNDTNSRSNLSGLSFLTPLRGSKQPNKQPDADAREAQEPNYAATIEALEANHPPGHNPRPQLTRQMVISRCDTADDCAAIVRDHAAWLPAWHSGRQAQDLHNWVSQWERGAEPPAPRIEVKAARQSSTEAALAKLWTAPPEAE